MSTPKSNSAEPADTGKVESAKVSPGAMAQAAGLTADDIQAAHELAEPAEADRTSALERRVGRLEERLALLHSHFGGKIVGLGEEGDAEKA